jgi:hypothetical protein
MIEDFFYQLVDARAPDLWQIIGSIGTRCLALEIALAMSSNVIFLLSNLFCNWANAVLSELSILESL